MEKVTKTQKYEEMKAFLIDNGGAQEWIDLCDAEINAIANKAAKAKVRAAEKKAEGDELRAAILGVLTDEPQTPEAIVALLIEDFDDITRAKVISRVGALIKNGQAARVQVDVDGRKSTAYTLATDAE